MQQQFFTLEPMVGQEAFGPHLDARPSHVLSHTPTTSSMLAALQHDSYPSGPLDPTSTAYHTDTYGLPSYMDTSAPHDDPLSAVHQSGLAFPDYVSGPGSSFDVTAFTPQDLGMPPSAPSANESEHEAEGVKSEA